MAKIQLGMSAVCYTAETATVSIRSLKPGDRVKIAQTCPIDPEGVGPIPGDVGQILAMPESGNVLRCLRVHFERIQASWSIPRRYLDLA